MSNFKKCLVDFGSWCGVLAPLVSFSAIIAATLMSPSFSWFDSALSDLGVPGEPTEYIFNYGLIITAVIGICFGIRLFIWVDNPVEKLGAVLFSLSLLFLGLVGVFPSGASDLHFPVAASFFLFLTYAFFTYGSGNVFDSKPGLGVVTIWLGIIHITFWLIWIALLRNSLGLAVPETFGAVLLSGWSVYTSREILNN